MVCPGAVPRTRRAGPYRAGTRAIDDRETMMTTPTDAPQDPAGPQPVMQPGAIDDATVPDP